MKKSTVLLSSFFLATACSSDTKSDSGVESEPNLYSLTMSVDIDSEDGKATFMTPTISAVEVDTSIFVGKPWYMAFHEEGAIGGVDLPIHDAWGEVGPDLAFSYTTPDMFEAGAYDAFVIVYVNTELTEEDKDLDFPPQIGTNDLGSFTLAEEVIPEGDPELTIGFLRIHADGANGITTIQNNVAANLDDTEEVRAAYIDTVLIMP